MMAGSIGGGQTLRRLGVFRVHFTIGIIFSICRLKAGVVWKIGKLRKRRKPIKQRGFKIFRGTWPVTRLGQLGEALWGRGM